jgi:hypothetical protein
VRPDAEPRPPIPDPMKREVRQRCGFGCVICGLPLWNYHHMTPYAVVKDHAADNLTLLCPNHHAEVDHALSERQIREFNADPVNVRTGVTSPRRLRFESAGPARIVIGSNTFLWNAPEMYPIVVDNDPVIGFHREDDELMLTLVLRDEFNLPVAVADRGEIIFSTDAWDIDRVGNRVTIRSAPRQVFVAILFDPKGVVTIERGRLLSNGVVIDVKPASATVGDVMIDVGANLMFGVVGIKVGWSPRFPGGLAIPRVNRYQRRGDLRATTDSTAAAGA